MRRCNDNYVTSYSYYLNNRNINIRFTLPPYNMDHMIHSIITLSLFMWLASYIIKVQYIASNANIISSMVTCTKIVVASYM